MATAGRILIVDDSDINRKLLRHILKEEYAEICEVPDGNAAMEFLQSEPLPDAVILDLMMPEVDGFEVLERLQADRTFQNLPVLVSTATSDVGSETKALRLGAWDYVVKPYDPLVLKVRLHNVIARSTQQALQALRYQTLYDSLTGIYNKQYLFQRIPALLAAAGEVPYLFVRLDIESFKTVNSLFGAAAGDALLCYLARGLQQMVPPLGNCLYGRADNDVFCLCIPDTPAAQSFFQAFTRYLAGYNPEYSIKPVFGVYQIAGHDEAPEDMLLKSTLASHECKGQYHKTVNPFRPDMAERYFLVQQLTRDIAPALAQGQFFLCFQPQVNAATGEVQGAEALVRWNHPTLGQISPGLFVEIFESNGCIAELDAYIWEKSCEYLRHLMDAGLEPWPISVNVSRVSMYSSKLVPTLLKLVQRYQVPPRLLHLEITESAYIASPQTAVQKLDALHANGFSLLMDDFGSGYSSFNSLKDLPVDVLKLDIGFLSQAHLSHKASVILSAIMELAHKLDMRVVAEGVQNEEHYRFYKEIGCDYIQGFYFSRPLSSQAFEELCRKPAPVTLSPAPEE